MFFRSEPHQRFVQRFLSGVGGENDDDIAEIGLAAVVVCQCAVIHHLQQHVIDVRMRFFDFIEQQHAVGFFVDGFGQQTALFKTDVAWWRADQPRDRVTLHVFRHVETQQFDTEAVGQLFGDFGFADASRAGEEEGANRLARVAQPGTCHLDGACECVNGIVLAEDHGFQIAVQILQCALVIVGDMRWWNAGDTRYDLFDLVFADDLLLFALGQNALGRPRFVDDVDRLVR